MNDFDIDSLLGTVFRLGEGACDNLYREKKTIEAREQSIREQHRRDLDTLRNKIDLLEKEISTLKGQF